MHLLAVARLADANLSPEEQLMEDLGIPARPAGIAAPVENSAAIEPPGFTPTHRRVEVPTPSCTYSLRPDPVLIMDKLGAVDPAVFDRPTIIGGVFGTALRESDRRQLTAVETRFIGFYKNSQGAPQQCFIDPANADLLRILDKPAPTGEHQQRILAMLQDVLNGHHASLTTSLKGDNKDITRILLASGCTEKFNKEYPLLSEDTKRYLAAVGAINVITFQQFTSVQEINPKAASLHWALPSPLHLSLNPGAFTPSPRRREQEIAKTGVNRPQKGAPMRREGHIAPNWNPPQFAPPGNQWNNFQPNHGYDQRGRSRSSMRKPYNGNPNYQRTRFQSTGTATSSESNSDTSATPNPNPPRPGPAYRGMNPQPARGMRRN